MSNVDRGSPTKPSRSKNMPTLVMKFFQKRDKIKSTTVKLNLFY